MQPLKSWPLALLIASVSVHAQTLPDAAAKAREAATIRDFFHSTQSLAFRFDVCTASGVSPDDCESRLNAETLDENLEVLKLQDACIDLGGSLAECAPAVAAKEK